MAAELWEKIIFLKNKSRKTEKTMVKSKTGECCIMHVELFRQKYVHSKNVCKKIENNLLAFLDELAKKKMQENCTGDARYHQRFQWSNEGFSRY